MSATVPKKILTFLPLEHHEGPGDWHRDVGLVTVALRKAGHDAQMVMLESKVPLTKGEPGILATPEQLRDPAFWKAHQPWGIISNTWAAKRFRSVWEAMLQATPRLVDRLDTDGLRSHRIDPFAYWHDRWSRIHDFKRRRWRRWLSPFIPLADMLAHQMAPGLLDRPQAETFASLPAISAESPLARERIKRQLRIFGQNTGNVHHVPHPVEEVDLLPVDHPGPRHKRVVSIGRWDAHQKNFPMIVRILAQFLTNHPDWCASLVGRLPRNHERCLRDLSQDVRKRLVTTGRLPHAELAQQLAESRIFLMSSRHESFNIAAAEALCAGCSVAAPPQIATASWFAGSESGTVASRYSAPTLVDALETERTAWEEGTRDPQQIATIWRQRVGAAAVADRFVRILESLS